MNSLTEQLTGKYDIKQAILVYEWNGKYYLESHEIEKGKMLAGKPLTQDIIGSMVEYFSEEHRQQTIIKGYIPPQLLMCEYNSSRKLIVWYNKPMVRTMHFSKELHIPGGGAWQPGLIYVAKDDELDIYAVKNKDRPTDKDILYIPPYHNCSNDGSVCLGSAKVTIPKEKTYAAMIHYYETMFWGTYFTHLAENDNPITCNLNMYWKGAIAANKKGLPTGFDNDVLLPVNKTLNLGTMLKNLMK